MDLVELDLLNNTVQTLTEQYNENNRYILRLMAESFRELINLNKLLEDILGKQKESIKILLNKIDDSLTNMAENIQAIQAMEIERKARLAQDQFKEN